MRAVHATGLAVLLVTACASASDPPIKLPAAPPIPAVMPPAPMPVSSLTAERVYVIECQADCFLRAHPANLVRVTKETGPFKYRAKFADGAGREETRFFVGKAVFIVEAVGTGRVELDIIPVGLKTEAEIVTATIDVDSGHAPQPPPKPVPKVDPKPTPATGLRVLFIYESSSPLTPAQQAVVYSPAVTDYLNRKCAKSAAGHPEWRRWDKDVAVSEKESPTMRQLWTDTKPKLGALPQLLVVNDKAGQLYALPATEAEALTLLKQFGGE